MATGASSIISVLARLCSSFVRSTNIFHRACNMGKSAPSVVVAKKGKMPPGPEATAHHETQPLEKSHFKASLRSQRVSAMDELASPTPSFQRRARSPITSSTSPKASLLLPNFHRVPQSIIHMLLNVNHAAIDDLERKPCKRRQEHVESNEKAIQSGTSQTTGLEATFDKKDTSNCLKFSASSSRLKPL